MNQPEIKERRGTETLRAPLLKDAGMTGLLILAGRVLKSATRMKISG